MQITNTFDYCSDYFLCFGVWSESIQAVSQSSGRVVGGGRREGNDDFDGLNDFPQQVKNRIRMNLGTLKFGTPNSDSGSKMMEGCVQNFLNSKF